MLKNGLKFTYSIIEYVVMMKSSLLGDDPVLGNNLDLVCTLINLSGANLNLNILLISVLFLSVFLKCKLSFGTS